MVGPMARGACVRLHIRTTNIATATALTNHGTILTLVDWGRTRVGPPTPDMVNALATEIARVSPRLRPRIPTAIGHCFYVRRDALDWWASSPGLFTRCTGKR